MTAARRALCILWPAFLMAGVLEMLVFALVDPAQIRVGGAPLALSVQAVYTLAFFVFWGAIVAACVLSRWLAAPPR